MMMIVNAPMLFTGVWAMCKSWVDEVTRKKIFILGTKYLPTVLEHIEKDQLIDFLGGTNQARL